MINLPRLFVNNKFSKLIHPINVSITENIVPLSTATMTLPQGEELPARSYIELFTPYGSAGMYRVRSPHNAYGMDYSTAELEHMIAEVGDYVVKGEYEQMMAASTAVQTAFSHYKGNRWQLGSISALSGTVAFEAKYESVLSVILSVLDQKPDCMMKFDFTATPWKLSIVKRGTTVVSEGRLERNVTSATVTYDDSELTTRVWYQTFPTDAEGEVKPTWTSRDASTIKTYGVVEATLHTQPDMTASEIDSMVSIYLAKHKQPRTTVNIQADELNRITKERVDKFILGDLFRLAIPAYGITVELNITSISWNNVYTNPDSVTIQLGDEEDTVVTFLHNLDATGAGTTGGSGGGGGRGKQEEEWQEYYTKIEQNDRKIELTATRVDKANSILEQAGLKLTSKGVLTYVKDTKKSLMSQIEVTANRISQSMVNTAKKDLSSHIEQTAESIRTDVINRTDGLQSSIEQTASQIRTEVDNVEAGLSSSITQNANRIAIVVDDNNNLKTASIVAGINAQTGSYVKLSADKIDLDGYVTAGELSAQKTRIDNIIGGQTTLDSLTTSSASLGGSGGGTVRIYGQTVRIYQVKDTNGTTRNVYGYS